MKKGKKGICILLIVLLLAAGVGAVYLSMSGVKGMKAEKVSAAIADYSGESLWREFLTPEQVDQLIAVVKAADAEKMNDDAYAGLEKQFYSGSPAMRIVLEEDNIVKWMISYRASDSSGDWPGMVLISTGDRHWKTEDSQLIQELVSLFEPMAAKDAAQAEYHSADLLTYDELPFEKREFRVEHFTTGENNDELHKGIIYKNDGAGQEDAYYLQIYGSGTYTFKDGNFAVEGNKENNLVYENIKLKAEYHPEGGEIPVRGSSQEEIAAAVDAPYTEYRILSENTVPGEYRLYEIQREGKNGAGNLREYWLGYFEEECKHIFYVGADYEVAERYEISKSVTLLERKCQQEPGGTVLTFSLWDEKQQKEIPLYTGGYSDFVEAVDENHLVFYIHGRTPISDSYHAFPYLQHLTWTDGAMEQFETKREEICFSLDADNLVGKDAYAVISEINFTEDGIELTSAEDPEMPSSFYAAYSDVALTRITFDTELQALRLHMNDKVKLDETLAGGLEVPKGHRYIEKAAVERKQDGTDILLYLTDDVGGYYGETVSKDVPYPVLKLRFAEK